MFKSERGSITMIAFAALLFFTMYGIIIYSSSARSYILQSQAIENIQKAYYPDNTNMREISDKNGGTFAIYIP